MKIESIIVTVAMVAVLPVSSAWAQSADELAFQQLGAALKADDVERQSAIKTCVEQGIGENPAGLAKLMGVPVEQATVAWCARTTNGIAQGKLNWADISALNQGTVTPNAHSVLTTASDGH
ncbi:hypothetical protein H0A71_13635 [Alcaligenaceae bacterium]|nr:hypothetical protein [Alcaligenaceae bacterium]